MENRAAFHRDRCALVAGQHEDGGVIRRVVAPPPFPAVVGPGAADRPEHVAAQDPRPMLLDPRAAKPLASIHAASTFTPFDILFVTRLDIRTNLAPALVKLSAGRYLSGTSNTSRFHLERR